MDKAKAEELLRDFNERSAYLEGFKAQAAGLMRPFLETLLDIAVSEGECIVVQPDVPEGRRLCLDCDGDGFMTDAIYGDQITCHRCNGKGHIPEKE